MCFFHRLHNEAFKMEDFESRFWYHSNICGWLMMKEGSSCASITLLLRWQPHRCQNPETYKNDIFISGLEIIEDHLLLTWTAVCSRTPVYIYSDSLSYVNTSIKNCFRHVFCRAHNIIETLVLYKLDTFTFV